MGIKEIKYDVGQALLAGGGGVAFGAEAIRHGVSGNIGGAIFLGVISALFTFGGIVSTASAVVTSKENKAIKAAEAAEKTSRDNACLE